MNPIHLLLSALVAVTFMVKAEGQDKTTRPSFKALIKCFNGKIDSKSFCSTTNFQNDGTTFPSGGPMRCGFSGKVSEISWTLVKSDAHGDHYDFIRVFPAGQDGAGTQKKRIQFAGERIVVFQDKSQVIVIDPPRRATGDQAEQDGSDQPATAPEAKPEVKVKQPKPKSEERSQ